MSATASFPPVVTLYSAANAGALGLFDTESQFSLDGPPSNITTPDNAVIYTLPGLPFDRRTPTERVLTAVAALGGSAFIGPPDYAKRPVPVLGDFRGVTLNSAGDFARVIWTGFLWMLVTTGGPTVSVATAEQSPP